MEFTLLKTCTKCFVHKFEVCNVEIWYFCHKNSNNSMLFDLLWRHFFGICFFPSSYTLHKWRWEEKLLKNDDRITNNTEELELLRRKIQFLHYKLWNGLQNIHVQTKFHIRSYSKVHFYWCSSHDSHLHMHWLTFICFKTLTKQ